MRSLVDSSREKKLVEKLMMLYLISIYRQQEAKNSLSLPYTIKHAALIAYYARSLNGQTCEQ